MNGINQEDLIELAYAKMHFGKYKDWYLTDIPEPYFVWFQQKGFPPGKTGTQMKAMLELKINGLEWLLKNIRKTYKKPS
ncbi:DUF3820 family protein [Mesonia maritima]|uniref:DUF3820 family protein n=1 Tax=Mesonia maritima TaxID=1793873 RepID=A0ABU1K8S5_9FLAO|nr:DUF3820 family protein [Mesonia maritima]MDR6301452.1 hypothetical protein [Mesonia maritima]